MAKRKKPYVPGLAQLKFKPTYDWERDEAQDLYASTKHDVSEIDVVKFEDAITGMHALSEACIDLIIADPPFGIDFDGKGSQYNRASDLVVEGYHEIEGDYATFSEKWIAELPRILKSTGSAYIFSGWSNLKDILNAIDHHHLTLINHIIWKYQFGVFTRQKFVSSHYHVLFVVKDPKKYFFNKIENYPLDIWDIPRTYMPGQKKNGTKLPEDVVIRALNFSSRPGDLILDPFMGNGTTAVCAKMTYRHFLGFEKNPKMQAIISENVQSVAVGEKYQPYHTYLPTPEEIAEKYPAVKKHLAKQGKNGKKTDK